MNTNIIIKTKDETIIPYSIKLDSSENLILTLDESKINASDAAKAISSIKEKSDKEFKYVEALRVKNIFKYNFSLRNNEFIRKDEQSGKLSVKENIKDILELKVENYIKNINDFVDYYNKNLNITNQVENFDIRISNRSFYYFDNFTKITDTSKLKSNALIKLKTSLDEKLNEAVKNGGCSSCAKNKIKNEFYESFVTIWNSMPESDRNEETEILKTNAN